jgi:NTE family protein
MYKKVSKESTDGRLFDIVAGTSIGAINSSILVGHYLKNRGWEGSAEKLLEFWEGLMYPTVADSLFNIGSPVRISWDYYRTFNHGFADQRVLEGFGQSLSSPLVQEGLQICINLFHIWVPNS